MTSRKSQSLSVMTLCSVIMMSCALLFPAQGFASSGGGCNGVITNDSPYTIEVAPYCLNTDLSGSIIAEVNSGPDKPLEYDILGAEVIIKDTTTGGQVFATSTFDVTPNGGVPGVEIDFSSSQFSPAPVSGHTYTATFKVCAKLSTVDSGTCSNWVTVTPAIPSVAY